MKSLLAITPFFGRSGSEIALLNLLEELNKDFQVGIFTPRRKPDLQPLLSPGIDLLYPEEEMGSSLFFSKFRNIFNSISSFEKCLGRRKFDYILLNTFLSFKFYDIARKRANRIILYIHETELMLIGHDGEKLKKVLAEASLILCSSHYVKNYLQIFCKNNKAIKVLHPPLNFGNFNLPVKPNNIRETLGFKTADFVWGMSGATTINKNPKMFIEAAQLLLSNYENLKFVWIGTRGNDAYEEYLKKYLKLYKLQNKICFIKKKDWDYYHYLNEFDGFVLTSFSESFSIAALEAAAFNKPVVSFPCGGIMEAVPERLRWVTKEFSVKEISALMEMLMKEKRKSLSLSEIQVLLANDKKHMTEKFKSFLSQIQ
ncbi:glycosyltransferase family 4 protein [Salegentibacter flavus]|uniref:Glycosyltransferase involved in cell wall bisynthesis n=1 Tax=Salegentibacter flavus TaxID=287099 RepID=A0A1I4Y4M1_9FLAO|nr:glycosyltransferase family 4 protein [Salegentibacter flavus]SFN33032.1 Glycosyltransferase involved in cell wall bisynthesis [Salegentibacter flavus]